MTLYQTPLNADLSQAAPESLRSGGLQIELWQEDGVFLGMARLP